MNSYFLIISFKNSYHQLLLNNEKNNIIYEDYLFNYHQGNWYLVLDDGVLFDDDTKVKRIDVGTFYIKRDDYYYLDTIDIYLNDDGYSTFKAYQKSSFNTINFKSKENKERFNLIYDAENSILISDERILCNKKLYQKEKLNSFDLIECRGFRMVLFDSFLYINELVYEIDLKKVAIKENSSLIIDKHLIANDFYINRKILPEFIEPDKDGEVIKKEDSSLKGLLQTFIYTLAACLSSSFTIYKAYIEGKELIDLIPMIIFPSAMLIGGVLLPLMVIIKDRYLAYKQEKKQSLLANEKLENDCLKTKELALLHFDEDMKNYYTVNEIKESLKENHVYFKRAMDRINLSLGFSKKVFLDNRYSKEMIEASTIDAYHLFLELKKGDLLSFYENKKDNYDYLKKLIASLLLQYDPEEFKLCLVGEVRNILKELRELDHLYLDDERLFYASTNELYEDLKDKDKYFFLIICKERRIKRLNNASYICLVDKTKDCHSLSDKCLFIDKGNGYLLNRNIDFISPMTAFSLNEFSEKMMLYNGRENRFKANYSFKELLGLNSIYDLDIAALYAKKRKGLKATFAYIQNKAFTIDLHEKGDGPHGLVGGSTGSGKSELLISLCLSLCITYPPDIINIVLIDYKGGGIKEALSYKGQCVPHLVASYSNLENSESERFLSALRNESIKRQQAFKDASSFYSKNISDLDTYLIEKDKSFPDFAHLLILVDEFAELKNKEPEFLKELISFSRIGRSLGFHLLLATQKPAGCINEDIWSNSRFKISLKVQEDRDSNEVLHSSCATSLKNPGEFFFLRDGNLTKAQAIYSKNDSKGKGLKKVYLLDLKNHIIASTSFKEVSGEKENEIIVAKINEYNKAYHSSFIVPYKPKALKRDELERKYRQINNYELLLGEKDDYERLKNGLAYFDLRKGGILFETSIKEREIIFNELAYSPLGIIYIGRKRKESNISDSFEYYSSDLLRLFNKFSHDNKAINRILFIEDISLFLSNNDELKEVLFWTLINSRQKGILPIIFKSSNTTIPYRYELFFKQKCHIKKVNEDTQAFYGNDEIMFPFVLKAFEKHKSPYSFNAYLPSIDNLVAKKCGEKVFIGISLEGEEVYEFPKQLAIVSFDGSDEVYRSYIKDGILFSNNQKEIKERNIILFLWRRY